MSREADSSKPPSFQFYPRDFLADMHLHGFVPDEVGRYIRALCLSFLTPTPGIALEDRWREWMEYRAEEWVTARDRMSRAFEVRGGTWVQRRMVGDRRQQRKRYADSMRGGAQRMRSVSPEERSRLASAAAKSRWNNGVDADLECQPDASAMPTPASASSSSSKNLPSPPPPPPQPATAKEPAGSSDRPGGGLVSGPARGARRRAGAAAGRAPELAPPPTARQLLGAFRAGLVEELAAEHPTRDVRLIARKLIEYQMDLVRTGRHGYTSMSKALVEWVEKAEREQTESLATRRPFDLDSWARGQT